MSKYSKFSSLNDYKNLSNIITNYNKDDLSNLLTPSDTNTNKDNMFKNISNSCLEISLFE